MEKTKHKLGVKKIKICVTFMNGNTKIGTHHMNLLFFLNYLNFLNYSLNKTYVTEGSNTLDPVVFTCAGKDIHNIVFFIEII
jgi:hypothetical protein